jgi:hypothetical protein
MEALRYACRRILVACLASCLATTSFQATADVASELYIGVSAAQGQDRYGPHGFEAQVFDLDAEAARSAFTRSVSAIALEVSVPVWRSFSVDLVTHLPASSTRVEPWNLSFTNIDPTAPGPPPPPEVEVATRVESRASLVSVSYNHRPTDALTIYGRVGGIRTERELTATSDRVTPERHRFRDSDTRAWAGVGVRYAVVRGLTMSAEMGFSADGFRNTRLGVGWTF